MCLLVFGVLRATLRGIYEEQAAIEARIALAQAERSLTDRRRARDRPRRSGGNSGAPEEEYFEDEPEEEFVFDRADLNLAVNADDSQTPSLSNRATVVAPAEAIDLRGTPIHVRRLGVTRPDSQWVLVPTPSRRR